MSKCEWCLNKKKLTIYKFNLKKKNELRILMQKMLKYSSSSKWMGNKNNL